MRRAAACPACPDDEELVETMPCCRCGRPLNMDDVRQIHSVRVFHCPDCNLAHWRCVI